MGPSGTPNAYVNCTESSCEMVATSDIALGAEITRNFEARSNLHLLQKYGYHAGSSNTTALYTLISLVLYTLYVGVSTRIFRLFKCRKIMGTWYLTADYTDICFEGAWSSASTTAF